MIRDGNFEFLGAPVGSAAFCTGAARDRVHKAKPLLEAISSHRDPQIGLRLLRSCAGFCKMVYTARVVAPAWHLTALHEFDLAVRTAFVELTGLQPDEPQWEQACRGMFAGGLGLRSVSRHTAGAYLASRASTRILCSEVDPNFVWDVGADAGLSSAIDAFNGALPPSRSSAHPTAPRLSAELIP